MPPSWRACREGRGARGHRSQPYLRADRPGGNRQDLDARGALRRPVVDAGGILLLAPTGKAAVQLARAREAPAQNLAQFLRKHERWDWDSGAYYIAPDEASRIQGAKTVVIDEASMLTEEMLAATIDALDGVDRLILCGDPRQLPPIGAGRPFADLVALLRDDAGRRRRGRRAANRPAASRRAGADRRTTARRRRGRLAVLAGRRRFSVQTRRWPRVLAATATAASRSSRGSTRPTCTASSSSCSARTIRARTR